MKTEYFPYIQSNYGDQMQTKRERSQLPVFATWSYQFGKPRAKAQLRSVHLFSSPLMCVLINEIMSPMKLAPPSPEPGRPAILTCLRFDLFISWIGLLLERYVARFVRNRGAVRAASGMVGRTCPTFRP